MKFDKTNYEGATPSTLCLGCGHDQISKHIIQAFYQEQINPFSLAKISGIGCSSKTPSYFLKQSKGFNSLHGRMASIATGVKIANKNLKVLGVSGDGDTGSIGLGSFLHTVRKNIPMIYILENNGVYGLTKGQFSPTSQKNSSLKKRKTNFLESMDLCDLALSAGCGFIARSFSGDSKQMLTLLKLAIQYPGFAFLDVISPCVAYGNEKDFSHSFSFMKEKRKTLNEMDIIFEDQGPYKDFSAEKTIKIPLPQGSFLILKKLENHDPRKKEQAQKILRNKDHLSTGLLYYEEKENFLEQYNLSKQALVDIEEKTPSPQILDEILDSYR
ncbi:MAG: 2-oxoacid:ferredoxin oxidoreductase subunit beta [Bdellovibrionales bacterium]|nr:2-oxoacid:ferredoxin oxidoreductase subunit beta [Bdellovibrionales bacterium]